MKADPQFLHVASISEAGDGSPGEKKVRSASEARFPGSNARNRFTHSLTLSLLLACLLSTVTTETITTTTTLPLPVNPHHIAPHYERPLRARKVTLVFSKQHPAQLIHHQSPSEHLRIRHGLLLRRAPHPISSAMDQLRQIGSSTSGNALQLQDNTLGESSVGGQPASAASLLGLPVELQKNILEYVRLIHPEL